MTNLAHLNALRAFEASARLQGFAAAARELNVTPAAVGQLVRTLEQWLGTPLFLRGSSGKVRLVMTEAAERALPDIQAGLHRLALGVERMKETTSRETLTITISPAFAAKWLLPRIDQFHTIHPDIDVRLDTQLRPIDFLSQKIDVGVRYGSGQWPGLIAEKLMDEEIFPVCSPQYKSIQGGLLHLSDLAGEPLIHDLSMDGHAGFTTWATWLQQANGTAAQHGMKINNSAAVLQAAIEGQGIALARSVMAQDDVASGRLIRLFPEIRCQSPLAYYVVYRAECRYLPRLTAFRSWLFSQAMS